MDRNGTAIRSSIGAAVRSHFQAITPAQARQIVDLARATSPGELAAHMRGTMGFTWDHDSDAVVGRMILQEALEILDEFDPEFRPVPQVRDMGDILHGAGQVVYHAATAEFEVIVEGKKERFGALHEPHLGMDFDDISRAKAVAERLRTQDSNKE